MPTPTLEYKTPEHLLPRWPAVLLIIWTTFNLLFGAPITLVSFLVFIACINNQSMREEAIGSCIMLPIGALMLTFGVRNIFTCTALSRGNLGALKTAARDCILAELFAYAAWAAIYFAFFIREPAWESPHRLLNFILVGICTLTLPASTTLTRILIRNAARTIATHASA